MHSAQSIHDSRVFAAALNSEQHQYDKTSHNPVFLQQMYHIAQGNAELISEILGAQYLPQILDELDPLARYRDLYEVPQGLIEFRGNSLGVMPKSFEASVLHEIAKWKKYSHDAHFVGENPWWKFHEQFAPLLAPLLGAKEEEVVVMESLSANNVQLLQKFYHAMQLKDKRLNKILIEEGLFPSDYNNVLSTIATCNGITEQEAEKLIIWVPKNSDGLADTTSIEDAIYRNSGIGIIFLGGVNYYTGQLLDMQRIVERVRHATNGAGYVLLDLAHACGNVPLQLHDRGVDAAAGCGYKYLNGGPGAAGRTFVHEKNFKIAESLIGGRRGRGAENRFQFDAKRPIVFTPSQGATAMQRSNFPVFNSIALLENLKIFHEIGIDALRKKSVLLTGYAEALLQHKTGSNGIRIITPSDPDWRGAQLSFNVEGYKIPEMEQLHSYLENSGLGCEQRDNIIRIAPVPAYNTFSEVYDAVQLINTMNTP